MRVILILIVVVGMTAACAGDDVAEADGRPTVVASAYPLAEAVRQVGGDHVRVVDLTPPGAEPHDLELDPDAVDEIDDADLVVVVGDGFQPAVEDAARRASRSLAVLDEIDGASSSDPHVWLDPMLMVSIVDAVADQLAEADPEHAGDYQGAAMRYGDELRALDGEFERGLTDCDTRTLVTAHEAFGHLARAYGLEQRGIAGLSPDAEADPRRLDELASLVEREGITTVFTEPLSPQELSDALADETGAEVAVLDPLEGLRDTDADTGRTYVSVMRDNLVALRRGLVCR